MSLGLAYSALQRAATFVPEEKLQYGFQKTPLNQPNVKKTVHIPEEKLWNCDKSILELKEEQIEKPNYLSYGDIGYWPAKLRDAKFNVQRYEKKPVPPCKDPLPKELINDCGFQLGNIIDGNTGNFGCNV